MFLYKLWQTTFYSDIFFFLPQNHYLAPLMGQPYKANGAHTVAFINYFDNISLSPPPPPPGHCWHRNLCSDNYKIRCAFQFFPFFDSLKGRVTQDFSINLDMEKDNSLNVYKLKNKMLYIYWRIVRIVQYYSCSINSKLKCLTLFHRGKKWRITEPF